MKYRVIQIEKTNHAEESSAAPQRSSGAEGNSSAARTAAAKQTKPKTGTSAKRPVSQRRPSPAPKKKPLRRGSGKSLKVFYVFLALLIGGAAAYYCVTTLFVVHTISVEGLTRYDTEEVIATSGIKKGETLFGIDGETIGDKIASVYNYIETAVVRKKYPNEIILEITEAEPFAYLEEADGYTLISTTGKVLERNLESAGDDLIVGRGIGTVAQSDEDLKKLALLQEISADMDNLGMTGYGFVDLSDTLGIVIIYEDRVYVKLGNELELDYKLQFVDEVARDRLEKTGYFMLDASEAGEVMTKAITVSPREMLESNSPQNGADDEEE